MIRLPYKDDVDTYNLTSSAFRDKDTTRTDRGSRRGRHC